MFKPLCAGDLHQKLCVERPTDSFAADGQKIRTWNEALCHRYASVTHVSGGERWWSGLQVQDRAVLLVRLWSDAQSREITTNMRIVWKGRTYGITRVYDPDNRQRELAIECRDQQ